MAKPSPTIEIDKSAWDQLSRLVLDIHDSVSKMEPRGDPEIERRIMFLRGGSFPLLTGFVHYIEGRRRRAVVSSPVTTERNDG